MILWLVKIKTTVKENENQINRPIFIKLIVLHACGVLDYVRMKAAKNTSDIWEKNIVKDI